MPYAIQPDSVKTVATLGSVKVGSGLLIDQYGVLSTDPAIGSGGGGGATSSFSKSFTQTTHGFSVGNSIARVGGVWILANAVTDVAAEVAGIVSAVADANTFTLTFMGYMNGFTGLTDGTTYYLSATAAGGYTDISPSAVNTVSKPIFIAISSTEAIVLQSRGILN